MPAVLTFNPYSVCHLHPPSGLIALILKLFKGSGHSRVFPGKLFHRHVLRLVIGQSKISIRAHQSILGFLQVIDGFINLIDCRLEFA